MGLDRYIRPSLSLLIGKEGQIYEGRISYKGIEMEVLKMNDNQDREITDWPWNPETEKLTELVLGKIAENLPLYASDAIDSCLRASDERDLLNYFFVYCHVVKDEYFEAAVRSLRGSVRSEARKLAEEAFDLIDLLIQWVNTQSKASTAWPPNIYARWDTVVRKFDMCVSSGEQQELPAETDSPQSKIGFLQELVPEEPSE